MIVTRRRRKPFPYRRFILPLVIILAIVLAALWAPSRNAIANGPLGPIWRSGATAMAPIAAPFHFAAQNQAMTGLKHQIVQLRDQLSSANANVQSKNKQVARMQSELDQLQGQAANVPAATKNASRSVAAAALFVGASAGAVSTQGAFVAGNLAAGATPDMQRTAADWANMEPSNAAKLVQKLPISYDARVMALMSPDAVGAILDALPAAFAAQLTQENPGLRP